MDCHLLVSKRRFSFFSFLFFYLTVGGFFTSSCPRGGLISVSMQPPRVQEEQGGQEAKDMD
jgi:hypothetical protein